MKNILSKSILGLGLVLSLASCKKSDSPLTKVTPSNLDSIASNYYEQYLKLYPLEATSQGDLRYNNQLPINIDKDFISLLHLSISFIFLNFPPFPHVINYFLLFAIIIYILILIFFI